jgi:excisionase family DNA binding protein
MLENFLTPTQFAKKLGITRQGVHKLIREGRIRAERIGRQYFIRKDNSVNIALTRAQATKGAQPRKG